MNFLFQTTAKEKEKEIEMAEKAGTEPLPPPMAAFNNINNNNDDNKSISKNDEEEFVVVNPHQYFVVDPAVAVKHSNNVENENFQQHAPATPSQNTPPRPQSTMLDEALSRQGTVNNIGYPKGEFDSCSEDEGGDDLPPPPQDEAPVQESYPSQPPPYNGGNIQRENTINNIGYPKGEFDSDSDSDDVLNDYENFDPTTSLQRV